MKFFHLCCALLLVWTGIFGQQKLNKEPSLAEYSYLLYGDIYPAVKPYGIVKATGFFVSYNGKTYLATASHVFSGWNGHDYETYFPKQWYIRLLKRGSSTFDFFALNIRNVVYKSPSVPYTQEPDLCLYEAHIPAGYQINPINKFLNGISSIPVSGILTTYGYPAHYLKTKAASLALPPVRSTLTALTSISSKYALRLEDGKTDEVNYRVGYARYEQIGPGYSGSPVFYTQNNQIYFAGILAFGNSQVANVVKPHYLMKALNSIKAQEKKSIR
ncbi:hypothetical protein GCM10027037_11680 [Mucilaginibacter koreensis]